MSGRTAAQWQRGIVLVLGASSAALLAACGPAKPAADTPRIPAAPSIAPSAQPAPSAPATTPSSAVTIRVILDQTRVVAGQPIRGEAVLTNTTARPILVQACAESGWLDVGLTNGTISFHGNFYAQPACAPSVRLAPGPNRFPITVLTTYQACLQPGGQSLIPMPACTRNGLPPLPAGAYTTEVITQGLPAGTPPAPPITVTLLPPPTTAASPRSTLTAPPPLPPEPSHPSGP